MTDNKLACLFLCCCLFVIPIIGWSQTTDCSACGYGVGCAATAQAHSTSGDSDSGTLNVAGYHVGNQGNAQGLSTSSGGTSATADAQGAAAFEHCVLPGCSMGVSISGSGNGSGFTVTFNPTPLWSDKQHYVNSCAGHSTSTCTQTPPIGPPGTNCQWAWDGQHCTWYQTCTGTSPLIVDTTGKGFKLTDPQLACVTFNMDGNPKCYSWPDPKSGNAWLVYDANGDGIIDSGSELFGDTTAHANGGVANHPDPNGFLALAWYDQPAQGGDMNLILDKRDKIWTKLKLWIDQHCYKTPDVPCASLPSEVHSLESAGINSISLIYTGANDHTDAYNNRFKYSAVLNPFAETNQINSKGESCCDNQQQSSDGRLIYDVYLQEKH